MIKKALDKFKNIDKNILKIMFSGFKFSFIITLLSSFVLLIYILNPVSITLFNSGIILFKTGLTFATMFFICAFAMDDIKKQMI